MKIGIVCPYAFDSPGGVQFHIRDFTEELLRRGHEVEVLAPAEDIERPEWLTSAGKAFSIPFNGSVARLAFGPGVVRRVRAWLRDGDFDVIHVHEPGTPSVSMIALMNAEVPTVATFHAAMQRSALRSMSSPLLARTLAKPAARIAVSEEARRTLIEHHGGEAQIIPNGVFTSLYSSAQPIEHWAGSPEAPVFVFLGRLDEPRKGLPVFAEAARKVLSHVPTARFLIAGRGEARAVAELRKDYPGQVELLGEITDQEKASLLAGATAYVAPQLGGESFGIVLVEAMSAGTAVVASDIPAFTAVLDGGAAGELFPVGNSTALAKHLVALARSPERTSELGERAKTRAQLYDWNTVTDQVLAVYENLIKPKHDGDYQRGRADA